MDVRGVLGELTELVLPSPCAGCGAPGTCWCASCRRGVGWPRPVAELAGVPPTMAVGRYAGPLRAALLAYKERGRRELLGPLAELLAATVLADPAAWLPTATVPDARGRDTPGRDTPGPGLARHWWLVPAPSRASAARARGGDHMVVLARAVAERLAGPLAAAGGSVGVGAALRVARGVRDSVGLDPQARSANLRGRVIVIPNGLPPAGAELLLIDDVVTTGTTLRSCVNALTSVDGRIIGALVLCDATGTHGRRSIASALPR